MKCRDTRDRPISRPVDTPLGATGSGGDVDV